MATPHKKPIQPKVAAAGAGGLVTAGLVTAVFAIFNVDITETGAAAIAAVASTVGAFLSGYVKAQ